MCNGGCIPNCIACREDEVPPHLRNVVEAAKRNPYEAFASAAVALAFFEQKQRAEKEDH